MRRERDSERERERERERVRDCLGGKEAMSQQKGRDRVREQRRSVMTMLKVGRSLMLSLSVFLAHSQHLTLSLSLSLPPFFTLARSHAPPLSTIQLA